MALKLIVPPIEEPVTKEEAKNHCRVETDDDDTLIESLITAAREYCEGFQGRAYCPQIYEFWLDSWPKVGQIKIPRPPLISVESIIYYDVDDMPHDFDVDEYFVDIKNEPGWVVLNYGSVWPTETLRPANGVCITFMAGYESDDYGTAVPQKVKQAILLLIGHWYENREAMGPNLQDIPKGVDALLWMDRVF
jgi:uncharacterized phiE125 gp8 family phage protein